MIEFERETDVIDYFRFQLETLKSLDAFDQVPHLVMSHGFMEWYKLLSNKFPSLAWRGMDIESNDQELFYQFMGALFKRFWIKLIEGTSLTELEKRWLYAEGWRAYLAD